MIGPIIIGIVLIVEIIQYGKKKRYLYFMIFIMMKSRQKKRKHFALYR